MSFIEPNINQAQHNKKLIQELNEKKLRMRINTDTSSLSQIDSLAPNNQTQIKSPFPIFNTSGFFIQTDSIFGNQLLPVLPRF